MCGGLRGAGAVFLWVCPESGVLWGFHSVGGNETPTLGGPWHDFLSLGPNRLVKHQLLLQITSHGARGASGLAFPLWVLLLSDLGPESSFLSCLFFDAFKSILKNIFPDLFFSSFTTRAGLNYHISSLPELEVVIISKGIFTKIFLFRFIESKYN